jgi:hypothetical protein
MEKLQCCYLCDSGIEHDAFTSEGFGCGADDSVELAPNDEAEPDILRGEFECRVCGHWWSQCVGPELDWLP